MTTRATDHAGPRQGRAGKRPSSTAKPVPRSITVAAFAVPLLVLPSAAWRLGKAITTAIDGSGRCDPSGTIELIYVASLSLVSMSAALLTIGLVRGWGEVVPRWIPLVGGKPVPVRGATIAALIGAMLIALLTLWVVLNLSFDGRPSQQLPAGCEPPGFGILVLYIPLVAWAPLLFVVTRHYHRRRSTA